MRIVFVTEQYSKQMGYIENCLPKALARLGHEVHVLTTNLQPYYCLGAKYSEVYEKFLGPVEVACGTEDLDGFTLHRLQNSKPLGYARIRGVELTKKIRALSPDVVQVHAAASWMPLEVAISQSLLGYKLFTAAHQAASVMPKNLKDGTRWCWPRVKSDLRRALPGRLVSQFTEKCYAATDDCAEMAFRFYGVPRSKIEICPLGVDTEVFSPAEDRVAIQRRNDLRDELKIQPTEVLCVYTGRFEEAKNPLCLANAIQRLRQQGHLYRGLFIGAGTQQAAIERCTGCDVLSFLPWSELSDFYRAADVGVWPQQESLSMLDAAACAIPLVVSDRLQARERIDGNGITFKEGSVEGLAQALLGLGNEEIRRELGRYGREKMLRRFSWQSVARSRSDDYEDAISRGRSAA